MTASVSGSTAVPDATGHFGPYGGRFVPEALVAALDELTGAYASARADTAFVMELDRLQRTYAGRPTPMTDARRLAPHAGGAMMLAMMGGQSAGATTDTEILTPDAAIVFWRLAHVFFVAAELALAVFVGALAILALRRVVLTRWLGWFGLVVTVLLLIPPIGWAALLFLLPLWLIASSVVLWRQEPLGTERVTTAA